MRLTLKSIFCERTGSSESTEEPYLRIFTFEGVTTREETSWGPVHMWAGQSVPIDLELSCLSNQSFNILLHESDTAGLGMSSLDPFIGSFQIGDDHPRGSFNVYLPHHEGMRGGGSARRYCIFYDVTDDESDLLRNTYVLQLISLRCNDAQETSDEVFITINGERIWSHDHVKTGETYSLDGLRNIPIDRAASIQLWEQDQYRNDLLDSFELYLSDDFEFGHTYTHQFTWEVSAVQDAKYTLEYRVLNIAIN
jgi:hypothetical protein